MDAVRILSVRLSQWTDSRLAQMRMPAISQERYIQAFGELPEKKIAAWAAQENELGRLFHRVLELQERELLVPELSLAFEEDGIVKALLVTTSEREDVLTVDDWYCSGPDALVYLCYLLQVFFVVAGEPGTMEQFVFFVCRNSAKRQVIASLLDGCRYAVLPYEPLYPAQMEMDLAMSVTRFQALVEVLAENGYASTLYDPTGGVPYLEVQVPQTPYMLNFHYESMWEEEELRGFSFYIVSPEPVLPGGDGERRYYYERYEEPLELDEELVVSWMIAAIEEVQTANAVAEI